MHNTYPNSRNMSIYIIEQTNMQEIKILIFVCSLGGLPLSLCFLTGVAGVLICSSFFYTFLLWKYGQFPLNICILVETTEVCSFAFLQEQLEFARSWSLLPGLPILELIFILGSYACLLVSYCVISYNIIHSLVCY